MKCISCRDVTRNVSTCPLREGAIIEQEHRDLYHAIKKYGLPAEEEFYKMIAAAHLEERPDYYKLLKKYVEKS
jgi:hypothetical protein